MADANAAGGVSTPPYVPSGPGFRRWPDRTLPPLCRPPPSLRPSDRQLRRVRSAGAGMSVVLIGRRCPTGVHEPEPAATEGFDPPAALVDGAMMAAAEQDKIAYKSLGHPLGVRHSPALTHDKWRSALSVGSCDRHFDVTRL